MHVINKSYLLIYCLLLLAIPFTDLGEAIPNILVIILAVLFPFVIKTAHLKRLNVTILIGLALLLVITLSETLFFGRWEDLKFISRFFLFLIIYLLSAPILVKENVKKMMYSFLIGVSILLISSSILIINEIILTDSFNFSVGDNINRVLLGERPYVGFVYVISFFISLFLVFNDKNKWRRLFLGLLSIALICFIFFITARTSLLSLAIAGLLSLFYIKEIRVKLGVLFVVVFFGLMLILFNQNFKSRLTLGFEQKEHSIEKIMKLEPRYYIWDCARKLIEEKSPSLFGYGFIATQEKLNYCYSETQKFFNINQQEWFITKKFNTHNQYLNFYVATGLVGLFCFIMICVSCLVLNTRSFYSLGLNISMLVFFMFENVLSRQMGVELCGLVLVFSSGIIEIVKNKMPELTKVKKNL